MNSTTWSWTWDETLYAGAAPHYAAGRMPYPAALAGTVRDELGLDGTGRLLDVGCGPGSLTTLLAPLFAEAIGVDADPGMIELARDRAPGIDWRCLRAEELPAGLGRFRLVTFAQSFHWMDQPLVARAMRGMLEPGGAWLHVGGNTHGGGDDALWAAIDGLVRSYLGAARRAGRGVLPTGTRAGEEDVMRAAGWSGPVRHEIRREAATRTLDQVVSAVFSLSSSTPHLLGPRAADFERDLRELLLGLVPDGRFTVRPGSIEVVVWRP